MARKAIRICTTGSESILTTFCTIPSKVLWKILCLLNTLRCCFPRWIWPIPTHILPVARNVQFIDIQGMKDLEQCSLYLISQVLQTNEFSVVETLLYKCCVKNIYLLIICQIYWSLVIYQILLSDTKFHTIKCQKVKWQFIWWVYFIRTLIFQYTDYIKVFFLWTT